MKTFRNEKIAYVLKHILLCLSDYYTKFWSKWSCMVFIY